MRRLINKLMSRKNRIARASMLIEGLESRQLMSVTGFSATLVPQTNGSEMLLVYGQSGGSDNINVFQNGNALSVYDAGQYEGSYVADSLAIFGRAGSKMIDIDLSVTVPTVIGTGAGNDTILGGSGQNYIADRRYGNSLIVANSDETTLVGSKGNDTLVALQGNNDTLMGGIGTDSFWVNANGNDTIQSNNPGEYVHYVNNFQSYNTVDAYGNQWTNSPGLGRSTTYFNEPGTNSQTQDTAGWVDISGMPLFGPQGPVAADINQHELGDCYFLSTLAGIAGVDPNILRQNITSLGDGTYAVQFTINGQTEFFRVDGEVPMSSSGDLEYAGLGTDSSTWVAIYEKAFAEARPSSNGLADYGNIESGLPSEVFADFNASNIVSVDTSTMPSGTALMDWILTQEQQGDEVEMGTIAAPTGSDPDAPDANGLIHGHAYTVLGVATDSSGNEYIVVRNPWGNSGLNAATDGVVDVPIATILNSIDIVQSASV